MRILCLVVLICAGSGLLADAYAQPLIRYVEYQIGKGKNVGYKDANGRVVIPPRFDDTPGTMNFRGSVAIVSLNGLHGVIGIDGAFVLPPIYEDIFDFDAVGVARIMHVYRGGDSEVRYGAIDTTGRIIADPIYLSQFDFSSDGVDVAWLGDRSFVIKRSGERIELRGLDARFEFCDGRLEVRRDGKCGFVDRDGCLVIEPIYDVVAPFFDGFASVNRGGRLVIDTVGRWLDERVEGGKWGIIDTTGRVVIPIEYDGAVGLYDGLAKVRIGDRDGVIDTTGRFVLEPVYEALGEPIGGVVGVRQGDRWGVIDLSGHWIIEPLYEEIRRERDGTIIARKDSIELLFDVEGKELRH